MKLQKSDFLPRAVLFISLFFAFGISSTAFANIFEGTKIKINAPTLGGVESLNYDGGDVYVLNSPAVTLTACPGQPTPTLSYSVWTITRDPNNGYWCFQSPNTVHTIDYSNPSSSLKYTWIPTDRQTGFQNVKDFGAVGDGVTDDTYAIRSAVQYIGSNQGGTLYFPKGDFKITSTINLPPGILIQGAMGKASETYTNAANPKSPSRILLATESTAAFRIGENNENVRFQNIEITASSNNGTIGVEGIGKLHSGLGPTKIVSFDNVIFRRLDRGIYAHDSDGNGNWQFDHVKVESCYFLYNKTAGIYLDVYNTDWNIISSIFSMPPANVPNANVPADGIYVRRAGAILVQNTFAGGDGGDSGGSYAKGGDFIEANEILTLTIINSASERANNSIVYGNIAQSGNVHNTLTITGSIFGDPIQLKEKVRLVSTGNFYGGATVDVTNSNVQIYSIGDRFCYDNSSVPTNPCLNLGVGQTPGFQGTGKIMFQTGQPVDNTVPAINATIGNDIDIKGKATFSVLTLTQVLALPSPSAGAVVYCSNCNASSSPCTSGGGGALAVHNGSQWACK